MRAMNPQPRSRTIITVMLAVSDTPKAVAWYQQALDARILWSLGSVAALEIDGAPILLHEPVKGKFAPPEQIGTTTVRIEVFVDNPDEFVARAAKAGAEADQMKDYEAPRGVHRQGGFTDPFGHRWLVGDKSPLQTLLV